MRSLINPGYRLELGFPASSGAKTNDNPTMSARCRNDTELMPTPVELYAIKTSVEGMGGLCHDLQGDPKE
jgi:hypothetical protein